jgi:hypothetical protein
MKNNYSKLKDGFGRGLVKAAACLSFVLLGTEAKSQCSTTFTPATSCSSGDQIQTFILDNIAASGNNGCSANAYGLFNSPVWTLLVGSSYNWTVTNGPTWPQGVAIWIDLNGDNILTSNEQLANDPSGLMHTGSFVIPFSATGGTNRRMRVRCQYNTTLPNTNSTACDSWTFGETEDYLVDLIPPTPCNNTPAANSVVGTTASICPGSSTPLGIANVYTLSGITYTWGVASNSVGPYAAVPNVTTSVYTPTNITTTSWYQVTIGCANGGNTITAAPIQVSVQPVIISDVPYYEGFEGIQYNNDLPNCSWAKSDPLAQTYTVANNSNRIPHNGNKFASFYYSPAGTHYFYTNGIQLYAGVTYSAATWFTTEYYGYNTWNLSMMVGPNQSTTGLVQIANLSYAASPNYKLFDNTFTVPASGIYYVAVKAISNGVCCGNYLSWDDLSITIPCSLNTPTINITAQGPTTICQGQTVTLNATGLNTYTWSTGATTNSITDMPNANTTYWASGTNTITNCMAQASKNVIVNPVPVVSIVPNATAVCDGNSLNLIAIGANSYTWSTTQSAPVINVTPTGPSATYSVNGANSYSCVAQAIQVIAVNPLPTVTAQSNRSVACMGEPISLSAGGASSYTWMASSAYLQGSPVAINPGLGTTIYTVTGSDANGCSKTITLVQEVYNCVGINEHSSSLSGLNVYPNPNNGSFSIELNNGLDKTIEIVDVTGRMIFSESSTKDLIQVNADHLANGIYYVRVKSDNAVEILKVVKQ